jgi:hypothetical protein
MVPLEYLKQLHEVCQFQTREGQKVGKASNGELKRWIINGALRINGERVKLDDVMDYPIMSVVLFPNNRVTLL